MSSILITGSAGFIGSHLVSYLIKHHIFDSVIGIDNINGYYDIKLKLYRLDHLSKISNNSNVDYTFIREDITNKDNLNILFKKYNPDCIVHLAAQAGVRYSLENPDTYIENNIIGFYNVLESCRKLEKKPYLIYASSSSVYGNNNKIPLNINESIIHPISLYAATKSIDEILAYYYNHQYHFPITGLRFFTVYGPAGRPDMALYKFIDKFIKNETIDIYNYGECYRDFTYIDDIINGIIKILNKPNNQYKVYNLGNGTPIKLLDFINIIQEELVNYELLPKDYDFESHKKLLPQQPGDVITTYADISESIKDFNYNPKTNIREGIKKFIEWYKNFKNII